MVNRVSLVHLSRRVCHIQFLTAMPTATWIRYSEMNHEEKGSEEREDILRRFSISYVNSSAYGTHFTLRVSKSGTKV